MQCNAMNTPKKGDVPHPYLPLQYQLERGNMPGYPQGPVVSGPDHLKGPSVYLLAADRLQST